MSGGTAYTQLEVRTWVDWFSFDACRPVTAVLTSRYFQNFSGEFDVVHTVFDDLNTALSGIEFGPGV